MGERTFPGKGYPMVSVSVNIRSDGCLAKQQCGKLYYICGNVILKAGDALTANIYLSHYFPVSDIAQKCTQAFRSATDSAKRTTSLDASLGRKPETSKAQSTPSFKISACISLKDFHRGIWREEPENYTARDCSQLRARIPYDVM